MPLTREQARRVDQLAQEQLGLPGIVLMENAAINAAACVIDLLDERFDLRPADARVGIACGGGNNGGDGYAIARHLHNWGAAVTVFAAQALDRLTGDAAVNAQVWSNMGTPLRDAPDESFEAHVVVDALLGTGFRGQVRPPIDRWIRWINALRGPAAIVAIDLPSGLDCDTGQAADPTVIADLTVTFVDHKIGFNSPAAGPYLGHVNIAEIGVSSPVVEAAMR